MSELRRIQTLAVGIMLLLSYGTVARGQSEKKKQLPQGTPILWREPTDITTRDLLLGPGGERMKPDLKRVTFIKEEKGGYSKKYRVKDAQGRVWVAKLGKEAQSETAAVRLVWAVGYVSEINYLVPRLTIEGKGTFENVRLEARPDNVDRFDEWTLAAVDLLLSTVSSAPVAKTATTTVAIRIALKTLLVDFGFTVGSPLVRGG